MFYSFLMVFFDCVCKLFFFDGIFLMIGSFTLFCLLCVIFNVFFR